MNTILSLFDFTVQSIGYVFGRLGVELLLCLLAVYLIALVLVQLAKNSHGNEKSKISFTNRVKVCFMYGITFAIMLLGIVIILTIRNNGLHFFDVDSLSWTWYCGYLLMIPEIVLLAALIATYVALERSIYKSIK